MSAIQSTNITREEGLKQATTLNNGVRMPWLGLGVYQVEDDSEVEGIIRYAIEQGYRSIDTAAFYGNEVGVGNAIRNCGVAREELFVTTKIWNSDMREDRVEAALGESLSRLGLDYVDLVLLHWPIDTKIVSSWKAMEAFSSDGRIRAIGVSNFLEKHLDELLADADVVPCINQVEYHPYLQSPGLKTYCEDKGIRLEAWSPFMHGGDILQDPVLSKIGARYGKTTAQVIVRWILQTGVATIPKSVHEARIIENSDVFDFALSEEDMAAIAPLHRAARWGPDPAKTITF